MDLYRSSFEDVMEDITYTLYKECARHAGMDWLSWNNVPSEIRDSYREIARAVLTEIALLRPDQMFHLIKGIEHMHRNFSILLGGVLLQAAVEEFTDLPLVDPPVVDSSAGSAE